ncbi:MAG: aldehyde ferredoxin oxidoreductase family protein [Gudongella sp.]|jgi:aldehyde:ferredoxin oxidoreductase|nr:aldehyde ferredoxin oxidoreductase family protein [Gudongella sp.]
MNGYNGKILFVDLTNKTTVSEVLSEKLVEDYIGGYGFGAKILYDRMPKGADPLGPDNILGFISGLTNATGAMFGGRFTMVHKSPVTGGWNDSNSGGFFGPELKKAGFDAVFISGISEKPVYLWITDGKAEIRDAVHLWGMDTKDVWEKLKVDHGEPGAKIVSIGPSGERMSLIACPINDGHRAPGRGGGGAVMGSKKLKAILVKGSGKIEIADKEKLQALNRKILGNMKESKSAKVFGEFGTGRGTAASALSGDSPVMNWKGIGITDYGIENAEALTAMAMDKYRTKKYACASCPLGCGAEYEVNDGRWPVGATERPEYETASAFGSTLLCGDMDALLKVNEVCNRYGLDTISTGMTIAWAMECYDEGVLTKDELDGIDLKWGDGEAIVNLTQKMADGDGVGAVLANGSLYASKYFGKGEEFLQTASGIELPMHDPRFAPGLARTYQYDPTPGRHVKGGVGTIQMGGGETRPKYVYENTGDQDVELTSRREILNVAGFCLFSGYGKMNWKIINSYVEAITGQTFGESESFKAGLRIYTLRHAFNLREGITPKDMFITQRAVGKPPLKDGPLKDVEIDTALLGENFFKELDWSFETGVPSLAFLKNIGGLDSVVEDLYGEE